MKLSRTAKEAIKTALAMTISYAIALSMDWDKPMWTGFAVAFVSMASSGQSFNKAAMRMQGTLVAAFVALALIALFAQERWLFILSLSLYIGFCTYMMGGAKYQYFWNVSGFVCIIIALEAGPNSLNAFDVAIQRTEETGLGIMIYSIIAALLWRNSSSKDFNNIVNQWPLTQHQLYRANTALLNGQGDLAAIQVIQTQARHNQARFQQLLDAAETDSYEIWAQPTQWHIYQQQMLQLNHSLQCCLLGYQQIHTFKLPGLLPDLNAFNQEIEIRFVHITQLLEGTPVELSLKSMGLTFDQHELNKLSQLQKAALFTLRSDLLELEKITRSLFNTVNILKGFEQIIVIQPTSNVEAPFAGLILDIERLASLVQVMASLWLAFIVFIYFHDLPGGIGFVIMSGVIGMGMAANPQVPVSLLLWPAAASILISGMLYVFLMPHLSSFTGLGVMIFIVTFLVCYLFSTPQLVLGRVFGLAMFVSVLAITNEQSYSILSVFDTALMFPMIFMLLAMTAHIPFSPRPEKAFIRLSERFFRSSEYLMLTMAANQQGSGYLQRWRTAFHKREIKTLPAKLDSWVRFIKINNTSKDQITMLIASMQVINIRIQALLETRAKSQSILLMQGLLADGHKWCSAMQVALHSLASHSVIEQQEVFAMQLTAIMRQLETRIETLLEITERGAVSAMESENFYRLLGTYQGVSHALLEYSGQAELIDWNEWREARF